MWNLWKFLTQFISKQETNSVDNDAVAENAEAEVEDQGSQILNESTEEPEFSATDEEFNNLVAQIDPRQILEYLKIILAFLQSPRSEICFTLLANKCTEKNKENFLIKLVTNNNNFLKLSEVLNEECRAIAFEILSELNDHEYMYKLTHCYGIRMYTEK